jgi:hypothetical protein
MKHINQMELVFEARVQQTENRNGGAKPKGGIRAKWWFSQMRRVVDQALDWKSHPQARPEQLSMTLSRGR